MSDNPASNHLWQSWYGPLDIQAFQSLYGVRAAAINPSDTIYTLKDTDGQKISTITDSGGSNSIDCSGLVWV
jgi:hypothetical protein